MTFILFTDRSWHEEGHSICSAALAQDIIEHFITTEPDTVFLFQTATQYKIQL